MPTVLMIGGGQLSRMTHQAAIGLGVNFRVLAGDFSESAGQVVRDVHLGQHDDLSALFSAAAGADVITFDHEHVPLQHLAELEAAGFNIQPAPSALQFAQDKLMMRMRLSEFTQAIPAFRHVQTPAEVVEFGNQIGWPVVLKVARGGYDGRGVWVCADVEEVAQAMHSDPTATWLVEQKVEFTRELSAQVARSTTGEMVFYPVVETQQEAGICAAVIAPANGLSENRMREIQDLAGLIATELDVTGMLAVELFDTGSDVLVNELAMRPHNSGHWSMNGAVTSQFENHLRAILGWPLGDTEMLQENCVMVNLIGTGEEVNEIGINSALLNPEINLHLYGKSARPRRKIGHLNLQGQNAVEMLAIGRAAAVEIVGTEI